MLDYAAELALGMESICGFGLQSPGLTFTKVSIRDTSCQELS